MSSDRYKVENHTSTGLSLSGLSSTAEIDCSSQSHIEVVELYNCPGVNRIHFGDDYLKTSRTVRIGGDWSGSLHVNGSIRSLEFVYGNHLNNISIGSSHNTLDPLLRIGENGLITNSLSELLEAQGRVDDLLYLADDSAPLHVEIGLLDGLPFRHLGVSGHSHIESLTIHCLDGGAQSIVLHDLPNLKSIAIHGQTKLLEIERCPNLASIHGQGDLIRAKSFGGRRLSISGIWHEVDSPQLIFRLSPTSQELRTCSDISWVHIPSLSYDVQVKWSELFDMDISEVMEGIPIQTMIETLANQGDDFIDSIDEWTLWLLTPSEQYIAMRLITALCVRGLSKQSIWKARDNILASNKRFYNLTPGGDTSQRFSRTKSAKILSARMKNWFNLPPNEIRNAADARFGLGLNSWSTSSNSVLPIDRLDLEIWVETGGVGTKNNDLLPEQVLDRYRSDRMSTFIDVVLELREKGEARNRQDGLIDCMFEHLKDCHLGRIYDEIAQQIVEYGVDNIPLVVDRFIDALLNSNVRERAMIAVAAALMQYIDDIRLKSLMTTNRSSPDIGRAEAKTLHALSLAGRRAFTQGRIPPLEWPAIQNWRNMHEQ